MWGLWSSRSVVIAAATLAFVVACVLPALYMFGAALPVMNRAVSLDARQSGLLYNTIVLGLGTATFATLIGMPLGFVLARVPVPFKTALRLALVAPALLPPYVIAMALAPSIADVLPGPYGVGAAMAVLTVALYPLPMLATEVALRRIESHLEEAALLVARPSRVLRRITGPLIAPGVWSAALVVIALAMSEFSVPGLLGVRVFTSEVFTAFAALYDFGRATVLAVPLLIVSSAMAAIAGTVMGDRMLTTGRGIGGLPVMAFDRWRAAALASMVFAIVVMLLVPLAILAREAFRSASIIGIVQESGRAVINSLLLGGIGATVITTVALGLGYARSRMRGRPGVIVDVVWLALFTVPSTVVGVGLIGVWNRPGAIGVVYGTSAMLVLGYIARFLPIAALALAAAVRSVPASHEEAAAVAGVRWLPTMTYIVAPQIKLALAAVWVMTFILAFGEVGTSILVAPPGESTLPIRIYTLTSNAPPGHVAALALFQSAVILCPLALLATVLTWTKR